MAKNSSYYEHTNPLFKNHVAGGQYEPKSFNKDEYVYEDHDMSSYVKEVFIEPQKVLRGLQKLMFAMISNLEVSTNLTHYFRYNYDKYKDLLYSYDDSNARISIDDDCSVLSCAQMILTDLGRNFSREAVGRVLDLIIDRDTKKDWENACKQYGSNIKFWVEWKIKSEEDVTYGTLMIALKAYSSGISTETMSRLFGSDVCSQHIEAAQEIDAFVFGIEKNFKTDKMAQANVHRLKKRISKQIADILGEDDTGPETLPSRILKIITPRDGFMETNNIPVIWSSYEWSNCSLSSVCCEPLTENQRKELCTIIEEALDNVCFGFVFAEYEKILSSMDHMITEYEDQSPNNDPRRQPGIVNRPLRMLDDNFLLTSCLWACASSLFLHKAKQNLLNIIIWASEDGDGTNDVLAGKNDRLKKQIDEQKNKIADLEKDNRILEMQLGRSRQVTPSKGQDKEDALSARVFELERMLAKKEREIEDLNNRLDNEKIRSESLEEKIEYMKTSMQDSQNIKDISDIDFNRRYLFVTTHEPLQHKLLTWFPESMISSDITVTKYNFKNIDMVVCMTGSTSHCELERIKRKCASFHIPIVYCNNLHYKHVCETIRNGWDAIESSRKKGTVF